MIRALVSIAVAAIALPAAATTYTLDLTGQVANFGMGSTDFGGLHFDIFALGLSGLDDSNAITVVQGDMIDATVTLDTAYTIPTSVTRTDFLQYFTDTAFPSGDTGVDGTFTLFNGTTQIASYNYSSTTSGLLASYAVLFPPNNASFTFTSFTNDFTISTLTGSAPINSTNFSYALVSPLAAVPEPASWALLIAGFAVVGATARRRRMALLSA